MSASTSPRILRKPAVLESIGVSNSTLYRWIESGEFPEPIQLGPRMVGWPEAVVLGWIESRATGTRSVNATAPGQARVTETSAPAQAGG